MSAERTVAISFRVSPRFKRLLESAAARKHRSLTNMLEALLFSYCEQQGITVPDKARQRPARVSNKNKESFE